MIQLPLWGGDEDQTALQQLRDAELQIEINPFNPRAYYDLAEAYYVLGNFPHAEKVLKGLLTLEPNNQNARFLLSDTLEAQGNIDAAIESLDEIVQKSGNLHTKQKAYKEKGLILEKQGKYLDAIDCFTNAIELSKPDKSLAGLYSERALCLYRLGDVRTALDDVDLALKLDPKHGFIHNVFALCLAAYGYKEQVLDEFDKAIQLGDRETRVHAFFNRGCFYHSVLKDPESAAADFCTATRLKKDPTVCYHLALSRHASGNLNGAVEAYTEAIDLDPENARLYLLRADTLCKFGNWKEARKDLGKIIRDFDDIGDISSVVDALTLYGSHYAEQKKWEWALAFFLHATELDPEQTCLYYARARCALELHDPRQAMACLEFATQIDEKDDKSHHMLGDVYFNGWYYNDALRAYTRASQLAPRNAEYQISLGFAAEFVGDIRTAYKSYQRALRIDRRHEQAKELMRGLVAKGRK